MKPLDNKFFMAFLLAKTKERQLKRKGLTVPLNFSMKQALYFHLNEEPLLPFLLLKKETEKIEHAGEDLDSFTELNEEISSINEESHSLQMLLNSKEKEIESLRIIVTHKEQQVDSLQEIIFFKEDEIQHHLTTIESLKCEVTNLEEALAKARGYGIRKEEPKGGITFVKRAYRYFKGQLKN